MSQSTADLIRTLVDRGAVDEAQALAEDALLVANGVDRAELLLSRCLVHQNRGEHLHALASAVESGELFGEAGLTARTCDALVATAVTLRIAGDHETALSTLEHAEALARNANDDLRRARVLRQISIVSSVLGRHQQALSCIDEARALFAQHGSHDEQLGVRLSHLNVISRRLEGACPGDPAPPEIETHLQDWLQLAADTTAAGQARMALMAFGNHAIVLQAANRHREAADALRALLPRYRAFGMRPNEGLALAEMARCHESLGEPELARVRYREACSVIREAGVQNDLLQSLEGLARCEEVLNNPAGALAALKEVRTLEAQRKDELAQQSLQQRELRVELERLTSQWARQATEDPLTGLGNRRALDHWIGEHWPQIERGRRLALLLLDLDHFKRINDTRGHHTGDLVLQEMAGVLLEQCRGADLAVRYGGEEFVLALSATGLDTAEPLAERLAGRIAAHDWGRVSHGLTVTASIGVADTTEVIDAAALLTLADQRLYRAKLRGRNQVVATGG